jgi:Domain of unknown function (DUF4129)
VPSRNSARWSLAAAALLLIVSAPALVAASPARPVSSPTGAPNEKEIASALRTVKADPNLAPERTIRGLRWARGSESSDRSPPSVLQWLLQLMAWIAQSARVLVWTAAILLVALLGLYLLSLVRARNPSSKPALTVAPTHVQDLDIRPESLPDDIGAAARSLWDGREHRAALSLLYRGLLSRLVHVHNVPIRDSSTEGDCLQLTAARLQDEKRGYVARLIQIWQHAVYGGQQPETGAIHTLCDEFAPALDVA